MKISATSSFRSLCNPTCWFSLQIRRLLVDHAISTFNPEKRTSKKSKTEEIQIKWVLKWRQYRSNPLNRSLLLRLSTDMLCSLLFWLPPTPFYWVMVSLLPCFRNSLGVFYNVLIVRRKETNRKRKLIIKLLHLYGIEGKLRGKPEAELKKLVA